MSKITIINKGIKDLDVIQNKLQEREALVTVLSSIDDIKEVQAEILICSKDSLVGPTGEQDLMSLARANKIRRIIMIEKYSQSFSLKKELGGSLIKMNLLEKDSFGINVILEYCLEEEKFITGSKESFILKNLAKKVAATDVTVFINGPTGTGKEVVANYIHDISARKEMPFVAVNCAAIPENMLEAILFGHEKGSFTGASNANKGIFRAADGGTLLLDEISEMPLSLQAKLLRVLQERKVTPVGGTRDININVRIIATTNRNMIEEVKNNNFREDLYYRLNVFPIKTYNLNKRVDDIIPITVAMIKKHLNGNDNFPYISVNAQKQLLSHFWPGNVRELENVILRALVLANNKDICEEHILVDNQKENHSKNYKNLEDKIAAIGN
ncbi:MAG: AAA family ATPase [Phycisphaerae bacterium]|nr:AAA family ATPase [Phycisphaerae bacterium]